jgi:molecular chaperone GrpE
MTMENTNETEMQNESTEQTNQETANAAEQVADLNSDSAKQEGKNDNAESSVDVIKQELAVANDKYIRLYSEFDNFRRRTAKEKLDLINNAGADFFTIILPVMDDFERALKSMNEASDVESLKQGVDLIYNKLKSTVTAKGLKPMESIGTVFDADIHEAITQIPSPSDDMKGKVVDEVEKGYYLNEKVIRFAKVVVGA